MLESQQELLIRAAEAGDMSECDMLLDSGADINCFELESETSVLTAALENGHEGLFFHLVEKGAQLEHEQYFCDVCGMTYSISLQDLLESAIVGDCPHAAAFLIAEGAQPDVPDCHGETPREFAIRLHKESVLPIDFVNQIVYNTHEKRT